jgi:hypothetical protein
MELSDQLHAQATLSQEKSTQFKFDKKLGGHQSRLGRGVEEKKYLTLLGIELRSSSS